MKYILQAEDRLSSERFPIWYDVSEVSINIDHKEFLKNLRLHFAGRKIRVIQIIEE